MDKETSRIVEKEVNTEDRLTSTSELAEKNNDTSQASHLLDPIPQDEINDFSLTQNESNEKDSIGSESPEENRFETEVEVHQKNPEEFTNSIQNDDSEAVKSEEVQDFEEKHKFEVQPEIELS